MKLDLNRLTTGEQILLACSALLFLLSFFPLWGKYEGGAFFGTVDSTERVSAWNGRAFNLLMILGVILALLVAVVLLGRAAGSLDTADLPFPLPLALLAASALVTLIMLLFTFIGPRETFPLQGVPVNVNEAGGEVSRGPLLYVGLLLSLGMTAGAFMAFSEGGGTTPGRRPGPPPPPPGA